MHSNYGINLLFDYQDGFPMNHNQSPYNSSPLITLNINQKYSNICLTGSFLEHLSFSINTFFIPEKHKLFSDEVTKADVIKFRTAVMCGLELLTWLEIGVMVNKYLNH